MPLQKPLISHSEADSNTLCELRHYYAFGERIAKKTRSVSLDRGIIGHQLMEVFFKSLQEGLHWDECIQNMYEAMIPFMENHMEVISYLAQTMVAALNHFKDRIQTWKIVHVEQEFRLDCGYFVYVFKPDLIVREQGVLVIIDYKFVYDFYDEDMCQLSPQIPRYIGALRALDIPVVKGYYFFLRYREIKAEGEGNRYKLYPLRPTGERVKNSFKDLTLSVAPIAKMKSLALDEWHKSVRRAANSMICKSCGFKALCVAELNGSDGKILRMTEYEPSTYGYVEEQS